MTAVERLRAIDVDDAFRVMCEFDAERAELFLSRAALLVEGMTEKVAFPFVFRALGFDADREQISIVECGGKSNLPLFVEICKRARVPYIVVHDSDMRADREPVESEVRLNALIRRRAGARRTIVLEPDFEGIAASAAAPASRAEPRAGLRRPAGGATGAARPRGAPHAGGGPPRAAVLQLSQRLRHGDASNAAPTDTASSVECESVRVRAPHPAMTPTTIASTP